jgi:hypothetical protein
MILINDNVKSLDQTKKTNTYNNHKEPSIAFKQVITPMKVNGGLQHRQTVNDIIGNIFAIIHYYENYIYGNGTFALNFLAS